MAQSPDNSTVVVHDDRTGFEIWPELCTGCGLCQLSCTYVKQRVFALEGAFITIERQGTKESFVPQFTDDCDSCGFCINYCGFEAIRKPGKHLSWFVRGPELARQRAQRRGKDQGESA